MQKVMAGDNITASVQYYYPTPASGNTPDFLSTVVSSLLNAISGGNAASSAIKNNASPITSQLTGAGDFINAVQPAGANPGGSTPQAYLTIIFFDERFNIVPAGDGGLAQQQVASSVSSAGLTLGLLNVKAPKNGYVYIYISNQGNQNVYFDNFNVNIVAGNIIEEDHYYAYGLRIAGISSKKLGDTYEGTLRNNYLYNDKELFDDGDLNWYDYGFRNYDAQIGRFTQLDPLTDGYPYYTPYQYAGNEPIGNIDVDGLEPSTVLKEIVIVGIRKAAPAATSAGLKILAKLAFITAKGLSNALSNANTPGFSDAFGGNHLSEYDDPYEQKAYLNGRVAGDLLALAQGATEANGGFGAAAADLATGPAAALISTGGILVGLHGTGIGLFASKDMAWALKKLYQLNMSSGAASDGAPNSSSDPLKYELPKSTQPALTKSQKESISSLEKRINEHEEKLKD